MANGLESKLEDLLTERARLVDRIGRREGMVENKTSEQRGWSKSEGVYKVYESEIFRWNQDDGEMRARLSALDSEIDEYERAMRAIEGGANGVRFELTTTNFIKMARTGREMVREAEGALLAIFEENKEQRARERD